MTIEKVAILAQRLASLLPVRQLALGAFLLGVPALGVVTAFGIAGSRIGYPRALDGGSRTFPYPSFAGEAPSTHRFASQERVLRGRHGLPACSNVSTSAMALLPFFAPIPWVARSSES
ncbi:MAG: hypothetical protein IPH30_04345 [Betaproteobacteria bacterium]|nr:hypothetical protein [Betaproteobacteria bacterium]